jgi:mevalonate kinase
MAANERQGKYGNNVRARKEVAMDTMKSMRDQRKKEVEKAMEEGRKKHLKMLRDIVQELTGKSLSLSDEELSNLSHEG